MNNEADNEVEADVGDVDGHIIREIAKIRKGEDESSRWQNDYAPWKQLHIDWQYGNSLDTDDVRYLTKFLRDDPTLASTIQVITTFHGIGDLDGFCDFLEEFVSINTTELKHFYILSNGHGLYEELVDRVFGIFANHPSLIKLSVDDGPIGESEALSKLLENNHNLEVLNVCIDDDGAKSIARGLKSNSHLKELVLEESSLGDDGAISIFEGLINNQSLQKLDMRCEDTTTKSLPALIRLIKTSKLQDIDFQIDTDIFRDEEDFDSDDDSVDDNGTLIMEMKDALKQNRYLTRLELNDTRFDREIVRPTVQRNRLLARAESLLSASASTTSHVSNALLGQVIWKFSSAHSNRKNAVGASAVYRILQATGCFSLPSWGKAMDYDKEYDHVSAKK